MSQPLTNDDARQYALDLKKLGRIKRYDMAAAAFEDINTFAEFCFGIEQQPLHIDFHRRADLSPKNVLYTHPETAKTFQFAFIRAMFEAGHNQELHQVHISAISDIPDDNLVQVAKHVSKNERVRYVFPKLRIAKGPRSNKHGMLELNWKRAHETTDRDPSMVAMGVNQKIMGRRLDRILMDDIHDFFNTYTAEQTQKVIDNVQSQLLGRLMADGRATYIGHPWRKKDLGWWLTTKGWSTRRYDCLTQVDGTPGPPGLWPKRVYDPVTEKPYGWPWERLMQKKAETDPFMWWVQWRCRYPEDDSELFSTSDLQACLSPVPEWPRRPSRGVPVVSGVDFGTGSGRDSTVITSLWHSGGFIRIGDIRGGLWNEDRFWREALKVQRYYGDDHAGFMVEDNGFQRFLVETSRRPSVMRAYGWKDADLRRLRIKGRTTGMQKNRPGDPQSIRALAIDFSNHTVELPADADGQPRPGVDKLIDGLSDYDPLRPTVTHTSDYVISYWEAVEMLRRVGITGTKGRIT